MAAVAQLVRQDSLCEGVLLITTGWLANPDIKYFSCLKGMYACLISIMTDLYCDVLLDAEILKNATRAVAARSP